MWAFTGRNLSQINATGIKQSGCSELFGVTRRWSKLINGVGDKHGTMKLISGFDKTVWSDDGHQRVSSVSRVKAPQPLPLWKPDPLVTVTYAPPNDTEEAEARDRLIQYVSIAVCSVFLVVVIGSLVTYMWRLQRRWKWKRFEYETPFYSPKRRRSSE